MARLSFQKCLEQIPCRYELVVVASKRAEQLLKGSRPRIPDPHHNPARTALMEISDGKLEKNGDSRSYKVSVPEEVKAAGDGEAKEGETE